MYVTLQSAESQLTRIVFRRILGRIVSSCAAEGGDVVSADVNRNSLKGREGMMHSMRRAVTLGVVVSLGLLLGVGVASLSAQATDPRIGTWKLNVAKSKFNPGPPPQSLTVKVEPSGKGEKVSTNGVAADGKPTMTSYTANFDGKDYPLTGSQIADKVSLKRIDARTTERTDKKDGKVAATLKRVVSQDGKTLTVTVKGTDAQGQAMNNVLVFDKQ